MAPSGAYEASYILSAVWTPMKLAGLLWSHLELYEASWSLMELLDPHEAIGSPLEAYGAP